MALAVSKIWVKNAGTLPANFAGPVHVDYGDRMRTYTFNSDIFE